MKVLLAYGFVIYLWPLVVFEKHLRNKSRAYRWGFCVNVSVMLANTGVLLLGLVNALRPWVTTVVFFCVFFWRLLTDHNPFRALWADIRMMSGGSMTLRRFCIRLRDRIWLRVRGAALTLWRSLAGRRVEFGLLLLALAFGTIYFSYGAFDEHSYGFGDQYVHHQWIYGLTQGTAFYDGIYPEAMHCVIYLTCTSFGIRLYSGVLFFAGIHIHVLLISAYLFLREVFRSRFTPLVVLAMFLTFDQLCVDEIFGMSRLSWTLPMEFGLYTSFLCAACLMRFFRRVRRGHRVFLRPAKPKRRGVLPDEDLFLFAASLAASFAIHFYVTIVAFFFCLAAVTVNVRQLFRRGSFAALAAAVAIGFGAAAAPMGVALAEGYPLQGSLYWAMRVIRQGEANSVIVQGAVEEAAEETGTENDTAAGAAADAAETDDGQTGRSGLGGLSVSAVVRAVPSKLSTLFHAGYATLYPGRRSIATLCATILAAVSALVMRLWLGLSDRARRRARRDDILPAGTPEEPEIRRDRYDGVLIAALTSVMLMVIYAASALGLPELVAGSRLCSTEQLLLLAMYCVPLDWLLAAAERARGGVMPRVLAAAAFAGVYVFAQAAGIYHGYLYYELTRYNAAVEMTNHIIGTLPRETYTIISTTDELYQVIGSGYHEELLAFLQNESDTGYTIPTPYLFLYIEKHPLKYAQYHFAGGPGWLAAEKYPAFYNETTASQCPDVIAGEISGESAGEDIQYGAKLSDTASSLSGRIIMESKADAWYRTFSALHPRDCRVIYEDEDFICCCITQNPACLYTLGVMEP